MFFLVHCGRKWEDAAVSKGPVKDGQTGLCRSILLLHSPVTETRRSPLQQTLTWLQSVPFASPPPELLPYAAQGSCCGPTVVVLLLLLLLVMLLLALLLALLLTLLLALLPALLEELAVTLATERPSSERPTWWWAAALPVEVGQVAAASEPPTSSVAASASDVVVSPSRPSCQAATSSSMLPSAATARAAMSGRERERGVFGRQLLRQHGASAGE